MIIQSFLFNGAIHSTMPYQKLYTNWRAETDDMICIQALDSDSKAISLSF